jgi:hypothetical protein
MPFRRLKEAQQMLASIQDGAAFRVVPARPLPKRSPQIGQVERAIIQVCGTKEQKRHGTNANGIISPLHSLSKRAIQILERFTWHGHRVPGKVP